MKHLFLVLLSLNFSVCVFSRDIPADKVTRSDLRYELPAGNDICQDVIFTGVETPFVSPINFNKMEFQQTFEEAILALREGKMVKRQCMKNDVFIFMQVPQSISRDIVPKMTSLPPAVKAEFERRFNDFSCRENSGEAIHYRDQLAIVNKKNEITTWSPLPDDVFAHDWVII